MMVNNDKGFWGVIAIFGLYLTLSTSVLAGGSIFGGGGGSQAKNKDGVHSIGVHICGNLSCPDVIIKQGDCGNIENAFMQYGVCTCMDGYKVSGNKCVLKEDKCKGKKLKDCQESCDPLTGKIANKPDDANCDYNGDGIQNDGLCYMGVCEPNIIPSIDGWTGDESKRCEESSKPGTCSICLIVENTVDAHGQNEFWTDSNALCPKNNFCSAGSCQTLTGTGCIKNSDCLGQKTPSGEECSSDKCYCNYGNPYKNIDYPTTTGTCALNTDYLEFFYDGERRIIVHTDKDVWSSKNFCESLNMRLMTWNELNCYVNASKNAVLDYSDGTYLKEALKTIYPVASSGYFFAVGYTEDYGLFKAAPTLSELSSSLPFFFCR